MRQIEAIEISSGPEKAAHELLSKTLVHDGMINIPIDVDFIAQRLGVTVMRLDLEDGVDGLLVRDSPYEPFRAVIDSKSHRARARFTLAHELGHYVHSYQDLADEEIAGVVERRDGLSSKGIDPEEKWANAFAAALLMPAQVVAKLWAENLSIEEMSDRLGVSLTAISLRVGKLGLR